MITIGTWNVNGIRARHTQFVEWIERDHPDIVCLQEIKAKPEQVPGMLAELADYWCYWHGGGGYSGVALLVRKSVCPDSPSFTHPEFDHETRIVSVKVGELEVASVYVPNGGKDFDAKMKFLKSLESYAGLSRSTNLVLCGDMNVARSDMDVHPKERKATAIGQLPVEREAFERILSAGLVDVGRTLDPNNDQLFTWWAPWRNLRQRNIGWRLDYVLAAKHLASKAASCSVLASFGTSDHAPVVASFN